MAHGSMKKESSKIALKASSENHEDSVTFSEEPGIY